MSGGELFASASHFSANDWFMNTLLVSGGIGLVLDGLAQSAGLSMLVSGTVLYKRNRRPAVRVVMLPYGSLSEAGLLFTGSF